MGALWELPGSSLGALWELVAVAGMECMQTINQANMMHGAKIWMIFVQLVVLVTSLPTKHQLLLQQHLLINKSLPSMTSFVMLFVLKPDFQLRQSIASGRTLRVLCRSGSWVE
jgi:hypothetical protein